MPHHAILKKKTRHAKAPIPPQPIYKKKTRHQVRVPPQAYDPEETDSESDIEEKT
jgi:TATA-binding protein-associated factor Taf7